jgi:hypothetical protein
VAALRPSSLHVITPAVWFPGLRRPQARQALVDAVNATQRAESAIQHRNETYTDYGS